MGNQAGIIIRNVKNELFHSAKRLILNEVKGIECLRLIVPLNILFSTFTVADEGFLVIRADTRTFVSITA